MLEWLFPAFCNHFYQIMTKVKSFVSCGRIYLCWLVAVSVTNISFSLLKSWSPNVSIMGYIKHKLSSMIHTCHPFTITARHQWPHRHSLATGQRCGKRWNRWVVGTLSTWQACVVADMCILVDNTCVSLLEVHKYRWPPVNWVRVMNTKCVCLQRRFNRQQFRFNWAFKQIRDAKQLNHRDNRVNS